MTIPLESILGYSAATLSMASFVPQVWKIIVSGGTRDISVVMYVATVSAFGLWCAYGIVLHQWPLVFSNTVCFLLSAAILFMKLSSLHARSPAASPPPGTSEPANAKPGA